MICETLADGYAIRVNRFLCRAQPGDEPFPEVHTSFNLAYVERGSFGYRTGGRDFELVAGSLLVGLPGAEYICTHEHHHGGDECLALHLAPELVDELFGTAQFGPACGVPPLAELMVLGELTAASAAGRTDLGIDEVALRLVQRWAALRSSRAHAASVIHGHDRKRAVEAALFIEAHASQPIRLDDCAARVGLSPFRLLRVFSRVLGVTPHQYLIRARLREAARLLAEGGLSTTEIALRVGFGDLSNFVRTFRRAAGTTPGRFQRASRRKRNAMLERIRSH